MLGGYLIGKGKINAFNTLLTILPICAAFLGLLFFIILASTGPYYWTAFFFASDDDGFENVEKYVRILWWLVLFMQPINAMLAVYEGILYATQSFDYIRNMVVIGFTFIFLPLFLIGWLAGDGSITVIILSQTLYSLFLAVTYGYKVHTSLIVELKQQMLLEKQNEASLLSSPSSSTDSQVGPIDIELSPIHRIVE
jgi:Na+-driven multidrug efflux pump